MITLRYYNFTVINIHATIPHVSLANLSSASQAFRPLPAPPLPTWRQPKLFLLFPQLRLCTRAPVSATPFLRWACFTVLWILGGWGLIPHGDCDISSISRT